MLAADSAREALRSAGIRLTPQRLMIIDALVGNRTHPTIEMIYDTVRARYPSVSLATVYQTVTLLGKHGLVLELRGGKDGLRCDPDTSVHAHAYCAHCGAVADVPLSTPMALDTNELDAFTITQVEIALHGLCARCVTAGETV